MVDSELHGVYRCSGLTIASDIPLSAPLAPAGDPAHADVTLILGEERDQPFERPSVDLVAELVQDNYLFYTFCRVGDTYVGRLPWIADFVINADLTRVVCHPVISGRKEVIPIVIPGTITAFLLAMTGRCVLHGSAVDVGGHGIGFVGPSGQGKSTMAAIFCSAGANLVTDDVLPLEFDETGASPASVSCIRSTNEIRLRENAVSLAQRFDGESVRRTKDERHAVATAISPMERVPLTAIVLPRPDRERREVTARRLTAGEASLQLGRCERIEGWRSREHLLQHFADIGRVVSASPVFEVWVPWGPPFGDDIAHNVLRECGIEANLRSRIRL
jgi:hypothetical protein